jgi:hypothetical protein
MPAIYRLRLTPTGSLATTGGPGPPGQDPLMSTNTVGLLAPARSEKLRSRQLNVLPEVRCVDHECPAEGDPDMVNPAPILPRVPKKTRSPGCSGCPLRDLLPILLGARVKIRIALATGADPAIATEASGLGWPSSAGVVGEGSEVFDLHSLADVGGVDHEGAAEGDPDVVDVAGGAEEDEVAGLQWCAGWQERARVVLGLGRGSDADAGGVVGGLGQARTVEAGAAVAAPDVGLAELCAGELDGDDRGIGAGGAQDAG